MCNRWGHYHFYCSCQSTAFPDRIQSFSLFSYNFDSSLFELCNWIYVAYSKRLQRVWIGLAVHGRSIDLLLNYVRYRHLYQLGHANIHRSFLLNHQILSTWEVKYTELKRVSCSRTYMSCNSNSCRGTTKTNTTERSRSTIIPATEFIKTCSVARCYPVLHWGGQQDHVLVE